MKRMRVVPFLVAIKCTGTVALAGNAQSAARAGSSSNTDALPLLDTKHAPRYLTYTGHRWFSFPALVRPYAGATTAIYGWFPGRRGVKDSLGMGNYAVLAADRGTVACEILFYGGPHTLFSQLDRLGYPGADEAENAAMH
jgi:hypothetical protein